MQAYLPCGLVIHALRSGRSERAGASAPQQAGGGPAACLLAQAASGLTFDKIGSVELVGSATRIPYAIKNPLRSFVCMCMHAFT